MDDRHVRYPIPKLILSLVLHRFPSNKSCVCVYLLNIWLYSCIVVCLHVPVCINTLTVRVTNLGLLSFLPELPKWVEIILILKYGSFFECKLTESIEHGVKMQIFPTFFIHFHQKLIKIGQNGSNFEVWLIFRI